MFFYIWHVTCSLPIRKHVWPKRLLILSFRRIFLMNSQSVLSPALSTLHMTIPKGRTFLGWPHSMGLSSYFRYMNFFVSFQCDFFLLIGVTLRGALAAWWENEGELVTTSPEFEFPSQFPCCSPSIELSDFRQSARSGNERECKQTLKNTCQG